jgi:ribonuclease J
MTDMYAWVKPQVAIPVHGEALHLAEHAALARRLGVPEVVVCENGDLVRLAPAPSGIVDELPAARLYKDGALIVEAAGRTVADRRRLGFGGIVTVALAVTRNGTLAADPEVELRGIPEVNAAGDPMAQLAHAAAFDTFEALPRGRRRDPDAVAEAVTRAVRATIAEHWGKKPLCHVHVLMV